MNFFVLTRRSFVSGNELKHEDAPLLNLEFTHKIKMADYEENNNKHLVFVIIVKSIKLNQKRSESIIIISFL